jgi:predicted  nucleic acid-binding Zn-ribbon protein
MNGCGLCMAVLCCCPSSSFLPFALHCIPPPNPPHQTMSTRRSSRTAQATATSSASARSKRRRVSRAIAEDQSSSAADEHDAALPSESSELASDSEISINNAPNNTPYAKNGFSSSSSSHGVQISLDTPLRLSRLTEKSELQDLNHRLELYILKMRERDGSSHGAARELSIVREKNVRDLAEQKQSFEERIELLRKQRNEQSSEVSEFRELLERANNDNKILSNQLKTANKYAEEIENRNSELTADLSAAQQRFIQAEEELNRVVDELEVEKQENSNLNQSLNQANQAAQSATNNLQAVQSKYGNLASDYELLQSKSEAEISQLSAEVESLTALNTNIEDKLRKEFGSQLKSILADRQQQYEEEKHLGLGELREFYEEKVAEYREQLEKAVADSESQQRQAVEQSKLYAEERRAAASAISYKETLEKQVESLHESLTILREQHSTELYQKNELIKGFIVQVSKKDEEFQELMDVKIALDMEISQYRLLISNEEDRLGYQSPIKPRGSN